MGEDSGIFEGASQVNSFKKSLTEVGDLFFISKDFVETKAKA